MLALPVKLNGLSGKKEIAECWSEVHPPVDDHRLLNNTEIPRVSVSDMKEALHSLKLTSAPGFDNITGEHLKYAHPALFIHHSFFIYSFV